MQDRHPLVEKWVQEHRRTSDLRRCKPDEFRFGPNHLDYRQYRLLSRIFFAVENEKITPHSLGWRDFYFRNDALAVRGYLEPLSQIARAHTANLQFIVVDHRICVYDKWTDEQAPLEEQINDIASGVKRFMSQIEEWTHMAQERDIAEKIYTLQKQLDELTRHRKSDTQS